MMMKIVWLAQQRANDKSRESIFGPTVCQRMGRDQQTGIGILCWVSKAKFLCCQPNVGSTSVCYLGNHGYFITKLLRGLSLRTERGQGYRSVRVRKGARVWVRKGARVLVINGASVWVSKGIGYKFVRGLGYWSVKGLRDACKMGLWYWSVRELGQSVRGLRY